MASRGLCCISLPSCSVRFGSTSTTATSQPQFAANQIGTNTYHVTLTHDPTKPQPEPDYGGEEEPIDETLIRHFGKRIPPAAIFECTSSYFIQFRINSVEAVRFVEIERSRLIPTNYTSPLTSPDGYVNFLRVQVLLEANATGEYEFYNPKNVHLTESFYIFAQTEPVSLLGVGRRLTTVPAGNKLIIPCVSPNPNSSMHLWTIDDKEEGFDEVLVDNESVFYNRQQGFILMAQSRLGYNSDFQRYFRCTVEKPWHIPPLVEIDVLQNGVQHHPDVSINLLKGGGAECYGIPGSDVKLYKVIANEDEAPEIIKCFEQRKEHCGERPLHQDVEIGTPVHPDQSGKASVSVLRFTDDSGLLVCTSQSEIISTMFFQGLDGKYYGNDILAAPVDVLLRIELVPDPNKEVVLAGSVITVMTDEASDVFVDSPRLVFIQFRNGSTSPVYALYKGDARESSKSFLVTSDITGVLVNDQFRTTGKTINLLKTFTVKQRECGIYQFRCDSGECIPIGKVCDHRIHCRDGKSDEFKCKKFIRNCTSDEFKCSSGQCISVSLQCSGTAECFDDSDEHSNCTVCGQDRFRCKNGECIRKTYVCDSDADCDDGSDETADLCHDCNGDEDKFKCHKGGCIYKARVCDGHSNCEDGSDEAPSACSDVIPVIVNEEMVYEFPLNKNNYLVCEVIIPQQQAHQDRFQPHVNWTFTPLNASASHGRSFDSKIPTKLKMNPNRKSQRANFSTFYFAYKLTNFDASKKGVYRCSAYNEIGSQHRDFLALLIGDECAPSTPRPGHDNRPEFVQEGEGAPVTFECRGPGKYPDPNNCTVFHDCVPSGGGYLDYRFDCAPGTVFCPQTQNCGWETTCPCKVALNKKRNKVQQFNFV